MATTWTLDHSAAQNLHSTISTWEICHSKSICLSSLTFMDCFQTEIFHHIHSWHQSNFTTKHPGHVSRVLSAQYYSTVAVITFTIFGQYLIKLCHVKCSNLIIYWVWPFGFCLGQPGWAGTRRNIHPLTPMVVIKYPYLLPPSTTIHGTLPIQSTRFTVFFHNLSQVFFGLPLGMALFTG